MNPAERQDPSTGQTACPCDRETSLLSALFTEGRIVAAVALAPDDADAHSKLGAALMERGRLEEAETSCRRALAIEPEMPEAWAALIRIRNTTPAAGDWLQAAEQIAGRDLEPGKESKLRYALGQYYDDIGDFDRAFHHYRRANDLKRRSGQAYDRRLWGDLVERIVRG